MSDFELSLDDRETQALFRAMEKRGRAPGEAFRKIRPHMRKDQREHAARREGPESSWPRRAPSTIAKSARSKTGRRIVRRPLGKLPSAVTYFANDRGAFAKSRVRWSGAHQHGARIARGHVLPARPFLWISDSLTRIAGRLLADYVTGGR
jgi:phage gpG-like protein